MQSSKGWGQTLTMASRASRPLEATWGRVSEEERERGDERGERRRKRSESVLPISYLSLPSFLSSCLQSPHPLTPPPLPPHTPTL
jgi:hypothetical protein